MYLPFVFTASGNYEAVVEVDTGKAVSETNEANNLEILPITVLPPGMNLVLEEFTVKPVEPDPTESVVQGRPAIATIKVTNTGNVPAGTFIVSWTPYALGKTVDEDGEWPRTGGKHDRDDGIHVPDGDDGHRDRVGRLDARRQRDRRGR